MGCIFCQQPPLHKPPKHCRLSHGGPCSPCSKLKALEFRISRVKQKFLEAQKTMTDLVKQHQDLKAQINRVHDPIIKRLPPEIISSIFQFRVRHIPFDTKASYDSSVEPIWAYITAPLILGAVCRGWRNIAWSTPGLWKSILVRLNSTNLPWHVDFIRAWLDRSGGLPLAVLVYCDKQPKLFEAVGAMASVINRQSSRWQILDLRLPSDIMSWFCGGLQSESILRSIRLEPSDGRVSDNPFKMWNVIPKPAKVFTSSMRYKSIVIEWDNVTWVETEFLQIDECFELLKRAPLIRH
ncbi:hypothetical protein CPB84DRAFT_285526 [Gymnopilus junonius]|uniref:F-box domain-containing protein n=1 Tax=Gymnopilus junonius TaxID=109634 RepID=A0A9P5NCR1_GYMJU|nr:hypothetical protein CPB84DRAFT_285526 [Gymnopilus junonius]